MEHLAAVKYAWAISEEEPLFLVANGGEYLVEGPCERWDFHVDDGEHEESVLRVFADYEDAVLYCELQRGNYLADEESMLVVKATLAQLFDLLSVIQRNSIAEHDVSVRIDFSVMPTDNDIPTAIDCLHSTHTVVH